jgi:hypothetical protein
MKRCLPKKMAPTWEEIEAYAQGHWQRVKRQSIARIFSTEFRGLQFNVLDTVLEFCLQCFLNEAGYGTGVLSTLLTVERVRLMVQGGIDGLNAKHLVESLTAVYLSFGILPPFGGARMIDVHGGNQEEARKRSSFGKPLSSKLWRL